MENTMIKIQNVSFAYDQQSPVFSGLSFDIAAGESVGLIGANGCGKSTLLKMLMGLLPHQGEMWVDGMLVDKKNLAVLRRKMGFVFQDSNSQLFMPTVYDDLAFGPRNYGLSETEAEVLVDQALERLGISHLKYRQNYKMSGGEKRMVCIAQVLAMEAQIILMDEPSITLDPYNRRKLIRHLNQMRETKFIASHDLDMILETCHRVILLGKDGIVADGPARDILTNQTLLESCRLELPLCMQKII